MYPGWIEPCFLFSMDMPDLHFRPVFVFLKHSIINLIEVTMALCGSEVYMFFYVGAVAYKIRV